MINLRKIPMAAERRKNFRVEWHSQAMIYDCDSDWAGTCILADFSNGGAKIKGVTVSTVPDHFLLRAVGLRKTHKCHVLWRTADAVGVEFMDRPSSPEKPAARPTRKPTKRLVQA
jgi:hypothetical protein